MIAEVSKAGRLITRAELPETFAARRVGLLRYSQMRPGQGMYFDRTHSIHTLGMQFPIDVVFLDAFDSVADLVPHVPPGVPVLWLPRARAVLELAAGAIAAAGLAVGDRLKIVRRKDWRAN